LTLRASASHRIAVPAAKLMRTGTTPMHIFDYVAFGILIACMLGAAAAALSQRKS